MIACTDPQAILEEMVSTLGETLDVDRSFIYEVSLPSRRCLAVCEWQRPRVSHLATSAVRHSPGNVASAIRWFIEARRGLESHDDAVDPHLARDGAVELLHGAMGTRSLLWLPFHFRPDGFFVVAFNQVEYRRTWMSDEQALIEAAIRYVTSALVKISHENERRRALEALGSSEERYRALFDDMPSMLFTIDAVGIVGAVNRFATARLDRSMDELVGSQAEDIVHEEDRDAFRHHLSACFESPGRVRSFGFRKVKRDGSILWVEETAQVHLHPDGIARALVACTDVTEAKRAEEAMMQAQKLEGLGVLAGGIAHDFNNLLVGIVSNTEAALDRLPLESHAARDAMTRVSRTAQRAADLVRHLLAYAGRAPTTLGWVDLNDVIRDSTDIMGVSIAKSVTLRFDLSPELPAIEGDTTQIRQVIMNLVINASEAINPSDGTITIRTRALGEGELPPGLGQLPESLQRGSVLLEVNDTGSGMDAQTRARIFDPFFTTKFAGRGLGLAAVLGIVRGHRASLHVDSEPGRGSRFSVAFPASRALECVHPTGADASRLDHPLHVLVVDDDAVVREALGEVLRMIGASVLMADGPRAATQLLHDDHAALDCVLVDLTMPEGGAPAVAREVRAIAPDLPIVVMSGYVEAEIARHFRPGEIEGFLPKPFTQEQLQRCLLAAIGRRRGEAAVVSAPPAPTNP